MTYHYRTVRCPHCKNVTEKTRTVNSQLLKGSPFRICPHCRQPYFDSEYHEPALLCYEDDGEPMPIRAALYAILFTGIALAIGIGMINDASFIIPFIIFGALAVISDIAFVRHLKNALRKDAYMQEYKKKTIDYLEGRGKEQSEEIRLSLSRLSNISYLDALKEKRVHIPDYFYQRAMHASQPSISAEKHLKKEEANSVETSVADNLPQICFCRKCGFKLISGSDFCSRCGTAVVKE